MAHRFQLPRSISQKQRLLMPRKVRDRPSPRDHATKAAASLARARSGAGSERIPKKSGQQTFQHLVNLLERSVQHLVPRLDAGG